MAIINAIEKSGFVYVYNDERTVTAMIDAGYKKGDGLKGYTGSAVSVQRDDFIYTYGENGQIISITSAR